MIYYSQNPSRYGGCFATHNPLVSQAPIVVTTTTTPRGVKVKLSDLSDANARARAAEYVKAQLALDKIPPKPRKKSKAVIVDEAMANMQLEQDEQLTILRDNNQIITMILLAYE